MQVIKQIEIKNLNPDMLLRTQVRETWLIAPNFNIYGIYNYWPITCSMAYCATWRELFLIQFVLKAVTNGVTFLPPIEQATPY